LSIKTEAILVFSSQSLVSGLAVGLALVSMETQGVVD
jgi:hypothetical protein